MADAAFDAGVFDSNVFDAVLPSAPADLSVSLVQAEIVTMTVGGAMPAADGSYFVGERVRLTATCKKDKALADPTTFLFRYKLPNAASAVVATYGVDAAVVRESVGKYFLDVDLTVAGRMQVRAEGTGAAVGADQRYIRVRSANV